MQNSYTKEGQLSWWLALLECLWIHKGRVRKAGQPGPARWRPLCENDITSMMFSFSFA